MPRKETLAIHGGRTHDPFTRACGLPVHRTAAYHFKDSAHAARLFALEEGGDIYSRMSNPTVNALEARMALLEGGKGALACASGTMGIFYAVSNIAEVGDEIVSANCLYGGTFTMFDSILPQYGIKTHFVPLNDFIALEAAITPATKLVYVESVGNPTLDVADIPGYARVAHAHGLPLLVDATFATPFLQNPLELGADVVIHSLTKWIGGHGTALGGIVVDGGTFDWSADRFGLYARPDAGYHGLRWGHDLPEGLPPYITRMRTVPLRNLGGCLSADNAWIFMQGLETLGLRMERHSANAVTVAEFLRDHPRVAWVRYPGLAGDASHTLAKQVLHNGFGGMVVFGIKGAGHGGEGAKEAGQRFVDSLQLFSHLANVGDAKSLVIHPGSTTHSQLSEVQQREAGLAPELIRLSIGIEHIEDIVEDLRCALQA